MAPQMTKTILIAAALCTTAAPAMADIFRGCRGWVEISTERAGSMRLAELDASGRCENRRQANRCRDRAQRRIDSCAEALVNDMDATTLPWQCTAELRSDTRVNWFYWGGVDDIPYPGGTPSGYDRVARHACCRPEMHMEVAEVTFFAETTGGRGCYARDRVIGTTFVGRDTLEVNCAAEVARGICGPVEGPVESPAPPPPRTNPTPAPNRTNPTPAPAPGNAGGDGELRLGN